MERTVTSKSSFKGADDHSSFYKNKTAKERLEAASFIINAIFQNPKLDRSVTSKRKFKD